MVQSDPLLNQMCRRKIRARQNPSKILRNKLPELCSLDQQGCAFPAYALPMSR
jgi:hypothetical protein